ncbi:MULTISPECIES: hypothetical protein [unclassified Lysinibacillus]|uniref:hypothetical protein n=1 Tax=unclassified Lysinibacillus TaxID=2636778 RepID=UPI00382956AA
MEKAQFQHLTKGLQKPYDNFESMYQFSIIPIFENLSEESQDYIDFLADDFMREEEMVSLPSSLQKFIVKQGMDAHNEYLLMQYNIRLMLISTMYQFWEQQVRKFLYEIKTKKGERVEF